MAGHVAPEAAAGGPIAAVRDGDVIVMDVARRRIDLEIPAAELDGASGGVDAAAAQRPGRRAHEVRAPRFVGGARRRHQRREAGVSRMTGAEILWECLVREGVTDVFGYPGGAILPAYDAMLKFPIRHVLVRHEQGATHMADGYARASGRVGVAVATSGPGATNMVTGIATAMMDSSPIVCITGQVGSRLIGSDAFQETDITGITLPITKHNYLVTRAAGRGAGRARGVSHRAVGPARPGADRHHQGRAADRRATSIGRRPRRRRRRRGPARALDRDAIAARARADRSRLERPLVLAGHGIMLGGAVDEFRAFVDATGIPVAVTLLGIGGLPASHPHNLGMMGMHGEAWVNTAIQEADLLIALGMRFDDRVTGNLKTYAPNAKKIHVDIDAAEIGKNVPVDVGIVADLGTRPPRLAAEPADARPHRLDAAASTRSRATRRSATSRSCPTTGTCTPRTSFTTSGAPPTAARSSSPTSASIRCGKRSTTSTRRRARSSRRAASARWASRLPAAIGAKMACPDAEVWAVVGDGGFQMTMCELATAVQEQLDVKVAIINNGYLGMVRQWQEFFYERRYAATPLLSPDFAKVAGAYGIEACTIRSRADVIPAVKNARSAPGPGRARLPGRAGRLRLPDGAGRRRSARDDPAAEPAHRNRQRRMTGSCRSSWSSRCRCHSIGIVRVHFSAIADSDCRLHQQESTC